MIPTPEALERIDGWGACRTCGGEVPYGHLPSCDYWRLEQELEALRASIARRAAGK